MGTIVASPVSGGFSQGLSQEEVASALPAHLKSAATQQLTDKVNQIVSDPDMAEHVRQNFVSYTSVLSEGRFKIEDYLNAVAYVSFKVMGHSNKESYKRTFPQRYQALKAKGATDKDISAYVSLYNKGKLVNLILEQTLVPTWILNQSIYQQAINTQAELMHTANSEKVRSDAADSLLSHLKRPEKKEVDLNIGVQDSDGMSELKDMLTSMAQYQKSLIEQGVETRKVAHQGFGEAIDITPTEVKSGKK